MLVERNPSLPLSPAHVPICREGGKRGGGINIGVVYCLLVAHHEVGCPIALLGEFGLIVQFEGSIIFGLSLRVQ